MLPSKLLISLGLFNYQYYSNTFFCKFQVPLDAKKKKRDMTSAAIRADMQKGSVETEHRIYISLPSDSDHTVHKLGLVSRIIHRYIHTCLKIYFSLNFKCSIQYNNANVYGRIDRRKPKINQMYTNFVRTNILQQELTNPQLV